MEKQAKHPILQDDILRYKKNKFASSFALLALVFNCLYLTVLYAIINTALYKVTLGVSVIINLLVLLVGFYASEGIKGYNKKFAYVLIALAVVQIIRIFYFPVVGVAKNWLDNDNHYFGITMSNASNSAIMIVYLVGSAACFVVSAVQGFIVARRLEVFQKKLDDGEVSVEDALAEVEAEEAKAEAAKVTEEAKASEEAAPVEPVQPEAEKELPEGGASEEANNG